MPALPQKATGRHSFRALTAISGVPLRGGLAHHGQDQVLLEGVLVSFLKVCRSSQIRRGL
jgi:hypothetical protein